MQFSPNHLQTPHPLTQSWLKTLYPSSTFTLTPLPEHADTRHYFRISSKNAPSRILMEADKHPNIQTFLKTLEAHAQAKLPTPRLYHHTTLGTLDLAILCDFGPSNLLDTLLPHHNVHKKALLYSEALELIVKYQQSTLPQHYPLPTLDAAKAALQMETGLAQFMRLSGPLDNLDLKTLHNSISHIVKRWTKLQTCPIHSDYHSANLMVRSADILFSQGSTLGILDFQDCAKGPIHYDLISLIFDHYIQHSWQDRAIWMRTFHKKAAICTPYAQFEQDCLLVALQRHLKNIGIFAKLILQGKTQYQKALPYTVRTLGEIATQAKGFEPLAAFAKRMLSKHLQQLHSSSTKA